MQFILQPNLSNQLIEVTPLSSSDFERLYTVANDPLLWEQHPNKDRYKKEVFETFFKGAIESGGALLVKDTKTKNTIGSSRFYDLNDKENSVSIGYTFIARNYWGKGYNNSLKKLMINHAFQFVNKIHFHIGAVNIRSQKAIDKLGAVKINELMMEYYGESPKLNYVYEITKDVWLKLN